MDKKIAFLVFPDWLSPRRDNKSFDGVSNIGAYMLMDVAERNGISIGFCSVDTAFEQDIVLVSMTSQFDVLSFYKTVRRHPDWQKGRRKFRVLCGGFGMQNPFPILDYVDSFWFGRCEDEFMNWLSIEDYEHESLMYPDKPKTCKIHQSACLYPHTFKLHTGINGHDNFREKIMGCPNKCLFCHFSFSRKHIPTSEHYNLNNYGKSTQELDMFNIDDIDYKIPMITIGLDGITERLRRLVNKPISDELVKETILRISYNTKCNGVRLTFYNITGYETESEDDLEEFKALLLDVAPKMKKPITLKLHTTPLEPSPATPIAYCAVNLHSKSDSWRNKEVMPKFDKLTSFHDRYNGSSWTQLCEILVGRFTEEYRPLLDLVCFNSKFKSLNNEEKLDFCETHFDLHNLVRRYETSEQLPSWVIESYFGQDTVRKMRDRMVEKIDKFNNKQQ